MSTDVRDNPERHRFELEERDLVAFANYRREPGRLLIRHVEAPPALRGTGTAGRLMEGIAEIARADALKIVPLCSYAVSWMDRHPEHSDLLG